MEKEMTKVTYQLMILLYMSRGLLKILKKKNDAHINHKITYRFYLARIYLLSISESWNSWLCSSNYIIWVYSTK